MAIIVVCPGCRKSYEVSEKFAGKTGPCPSCKRPLKVPEKSEQVTIRAPEEFAGGGRSRTGKLVTKPVSFAYARLRPVTTAIICASVVVVVAVAWLGGREGLFQSMIATTIALLAVSPPLVLAAYAVLRDSELEPYSGKELYIRSAICAAAYAALWGAFALLASRGLITGDLWVWLAVAPPLLLSGGMFAFATLDLDFGDAVLHYAFYLLATVILRWMAGMDWVWNA